MLLIHVAVPSSYDHKGRRSKGQRRLRRLPPQPCNPNRRDRRRDLRRATAVTIWIEEGPKNKGTGRQGSAASVAVCARVPSCVGGMVNDLSCRRVLHVTITIVVLECRMSCCFSAHGRREEAPGVASKHVGKHVRLGTGMH